MSLARFGLKEFGHLGGTMTHDFKKILDTVKSDFRIKQKILDTVKSDFRMKRKM